MYTLCNQSTESIRITEVLFTPGGDTRLVIVGGSCQKGSVLSPQALCTIEVQLSPSALGTLRQVLNVHFEGDYSPLWTEVDISVTQKPATQGKASFLTEETKTMDRQRRLKEQDGHRNYGRINAREHPDQSSQPSMAQQEGEVQNNILQNPWLNSQRFDGVDPNLNPEPPLNSEAGREFDNERREQEMEKQLRLGNMPRMSPAPKPQGF